MSNYRPISHLSFLSKLVERAVKGRLSEHLTSNSLLNKYQSAYTKFYSTESALLAVHDHVIRAMSEQKVTALCLLDLSAAFDTIDHSILLTRLSTWFGFHGTVLSWIESYLTCRSFNVSINSLKSSLHQFICGVPQGSVLGPLLFILYTTPLSSLITDCSVHHHLYADDTQLYLSFSTPNLSSNIKLLEDTISKVSSWMSANLLSLNPTKTEFLLLGLPKQLSKLTDTVLQMPSNVTLHPVSNARNLGVIFDSTLSLSDHISSVSKSCFSHIRDLRRIRPILDLNTANTIATALIHSKLDYCNSLFLNLPAHQLNRLQLILNSAARAVTKSRRFDHISPVLRSLHWLKIEERIHYKILSLTYKTLNADHPFYLRNLLTIQTNIKSTRSTDVVTLSRPSVKSRLSITKRSFYHHAPYLWNSLPREMRVPGSCSGSSDHSSLLSLSSSQFHSKLKTYLFHHSFPP